MAHATTTSVAPAEPLTPFSALECAGRTVCFARELIRGTRNKTKFYPTSFPRQKEYPTAGYPRRVHPCNAQRGGPFCDGYSHWNPPPLPSLSQKKDHVLCRGGPAKSQMISQNMLLRCRHLGSLKAVFCNAVDSCHLLTQINELGTRAGASREAQVKDPLSNSM